MDGISVRNLCKNYEIKGGTVHALSDIDLFMEDGSFTVVLGRSGCGKTTLLRLLCGLEEITAGRVDFFVGGRRVEKGERRIGMVFQEPRLMPWLTVEENMVFSLRRGGCDEDGGEKVDDCLRMLGLERFRNAYPGQISGGMAQRTALGRTLCFDPDVILMDEPFGALDYFTRKSLQDEISEIFLSQRKTIVFVTHDVEEALALGQQIVVLDSGRVVEKIDLSEPYKRDTSSPQFIPMRKRILRSITGDAEKTGNPDREVRP